MFYYCLSKKGVFYNIIHNIGNRWTGGMGTGETRGSAKVQIATESLCKRAKVEVIRGRVEKGTGGQGEARDKRQCKSANVQRCKSEKVEEN